MFCAKIALAAQHQALACVGGTVYALLTADPIRHALEFPPFENREGWGSPHSVRVRRKRGEGSRRFAGEGALRQAFSSKTLAT
jgi:hypothetical protein